MKIVYDSIIFSLQSFGGISRYWNHLLSKQKNQQTYSLEYKKPTEQYLNQHMTVHLKKLFPLERYSPLYKQFFKNRYIFHSSYYRINRVRNAVNVITVYDFIYEKYRRGLPRLVHSYQKKQAIKNADHLIAISENTKADILNYFPFIDSSKISVIPLGVEWLPYRETSGDQRLLFVGSRTGYKNFNLALDVLSLLPKEYSLIAAGPFPIPDELAQIKKRKLENQVHFKPHLSDVELGMLYGKCEALLYLSEYEGFGLPILEASMHGCPIIALNRASIPEVHGDPNTRFQWGDPQKMAQVILKLQDLDFRNQTTLACHRHASNFSWDKCTSMTNELYHSLINGN